LAHFIGEQPDGEQVYFSYSEDGLHWKDLNAGLPVLRSELGEKGVRDPFLVRSPKEDKFYLIATDLRIANGKGWSAASNAGSRDVIIWESADLVHWSSPWAVTLGVPGAGCVWAPEAIYDEAADDFLVFWASATQEPQENERKQKIYSARTRDFRSFTAPEKYIERENHIMIPRSLPTTVPTTVFPRTRRLRISGSKKAHHWKKTHLPICTFRFWRNC